MAQKAQKKEGVFVIVISFALALLAIAAPYKWHDMPLGLVNATLSAALALAIWGLWDLFPLDWKKVGKKRGLLIGGEILVGFIGLVFIWWPSSPHSGMSASENAAWDKIIARVDAEDRALAAAKSDPCGGGPKGEGTHNLTIVAFSKGVDADNSSCANIHDIHAVISGTAVSARRSYKPTIYNVYAEDDLLEFLKHPQASPHPPPKHTEKPAGTRR